jgi:hypothetical protein
VTKKRKSLMWARSVNAAGRLLSLLQAGHGCGPHSLRPDILRVMVTARLGQIMPRES